MGFECNYCFLQVVHDVDLQRHPIKLVLDRVGLVGADGPTHCGAFDTTFMACLPNMVVMAPSCYAELMHMVTTAAAIYGRPSCFRFPRGNGIRSALPPQNKGTPLEVTYNSFNSKKKLEWQTRLLFVVESVKLCEAN